MTPSSEPYLGEPDKSKVLVLRSSKSGGGKTQKFEDLEKLYLDSFQQFYQVLKPGGRVVIVLPIINGQKMEILGAIVEVGFTNDKLSDNERGSIIYGRAGQMVEREIFLFIKSRD